MRVSRCGVFTQPGVKAPKAAACYSRAFGTLSLTVVVIVQGGMDAAVVTNQGVWLYAGYLAMFVKGLVFAYFYQGAHTLEATRAGQFINLVPVSRVCLGAWLLDEPLTRALLLGGVLVLLGL